MTNPETNVEHAKFAGLSWLKERRQKWIFWLTGFGVIAAVILVNWPATASFALWTTSSFQSAVWTRAGLSGLAGLIGWVFVWVSLAWGIPAVAGRWTGMREHWPTRWFRAGFAAIGLILTTTLAVTLAASMLIATGFVVQLVMQA